MKERIEFRLQKRFSARWRDLGHPKGGVEKDEENSDNRRAV